MFDFKRLLKEKFRTPVGLASFMAAYGGDGTPDAVVIRKWFQRGSIPSDQFALILAYLEIDEGAPVRLASYIVTE